MAEPTHAQPQQILALVNDLFFMLKIEDTAKHLGWPIRFASTVREFLERLEDVRPTLLIADLTIGTEDLALLFNQLRASPQQATRPILGYTTHADWKRTGPLHDQCTTVVTKDTLSRSLPTLMQRLVHQDDA
jgi:CheY-like chemotaxis protein